MTKEPIKDWRGVVLGYVETDNCGNKLLKDFMLRPLGRYDKSSDMTKDAYGRAVGKGDILLTLLR